LGHLGQQGLERAEQRPLHGTPTPPLGVQDWGRHLERVSGDLHDRPVGRRGPAEEGSPDHAVVPNQAHGRRHPVDRRVD
jgi:hypothetical protein